MRRWRFLVGGWFALLGCTPATSGAPAAPPTPDVVVEPVAGAPRAQLSGGGSNEGARIPDLERSIEELRRRARSCHQQALNRRALEEGSYIFSLIVDREGRVSKAQGQAEGLLGEEVVRCLERSLTAIRFAPPEGVRALVAGRFELRVGPAR